MTTTGVAKPEFHPIAPRFRRSGNELQVVCTTRMVKTRPPRIERLVELDGRRISVGLESGGIVHRDSDRNDTPSTMPVNTPIRGMP
eukprot:8355453-Heterocapsa_arctica.AAC.1